MVVAMTWYHESHLFVPAWQACILNLGTAVQNLSSLPHTLADMCNSIALNGRVCQGFTYDSNTKVATFKGQMPQQAIHLSAEATPAVNVSLWWLNAGDYLAQHLQCPLLCTIYAVDTVAICIWQPPDAPRHGYKTSERAYAPL